MFIVQIPLVSYCRTHRETGTNPYLNSIYEIRLNDLLNSSFYYMDRNNASLTIQDTNIYFELGSKYILIMISTFIMISWQ